MVVCKSCGNTTPEGSYCIFCGEILGVGDSAIKIASGSGADRVAVPVEVAPVSPQNAEGKEDKGNPYKV